MYKLFVCLRYLRRRYIAFIAIIGVALCVAMVLIVISVMNGFLDAVENAAKGMQGDIVMSGQISHYDEFVKLLESKEDVKAAPVIFTAGLLRIGSWFYLPGEEPGQGRGNTGESSQTQYVQVVGVRLPEAARVTRFAEGLYPPVERPEQAGFDLAPDQAEAMAGMVARAEQDIRQAEAEADQALEQLAEAEAAGDIDRARLLNNLYLALETKVERLRRVRRIPELPGMILGVDLPGTTERNPKDGAYTRFIEPGRHFASLTLLPIGKGTITALDQPISPTFLIVGDERTGIYQIDSRTVYVDFHVLQNYLGMGEQVDTDDPSRKTLARCTQIQIKVLGGEDEKHLAEVAQRIDALWKSFAKSQSDLWGSSVSVKTWRQFQAAYVDPIEKQRTLVVIMFGVISLVAVVLVFAIFYMMVVQKTKDIGILKSIGASNRGVASIFLVYGGAVGLVGSVFGAVLGSLFVHYINPIHDWVADVFRWRVFSREAFLFDTIPNKIDPSVVVVVVIGAIVAGVIGAILPALRAASMQPVEALRYE